MRVEAIVILLLGAGYSAAFGIPTMQGMVDKVLELMEQYPQIREQFSDFKDWLDTNGIPFDLEAVIAGLESMADPKASIRVWNPGILLTFDSLPKLRTQNEEPRKVLLEVQKMISEVCGKFKLDEVVSVNKKFFQAMSEISRVRFASYSDAAINDKKVRSRNTDTIFFPSTVFTTNYDTVLESFLRTEMIPFTDGFDADEYQDLRFKNRWDATTVRLFKLHGSVNYYLRKDYSVVKYPQSDNRTVYQEQLGERMMIYPVGEKQVTSSIYFDLLGQLREQLFRTSFCIIIGYSFRDTPVNNAFLDRIKLDKNFKLILVSPSASSIRDMMPSLLRQVTSPVPKKFEDETLPKHIHTLIEKELPGAEISFP